LVEQSAILRPVISSQGIFVDPTRVEAILKWECLKTIVEVNFMGLTNRWLVDGFSKIVDPLTQPFTCIEKMWRKFWRDEEKINQCTSYSRHR